MEPEAEVTNSTAIRRFTKRSIAAAEGQFVVDCVPDERLGQKISSSMEMFQKTNLGRRGGRKNPSAFAPSTPKQQQHSATAKTQATPAPKQQQSAEKIVEVGMGVVRMGKPQSKKDEDVLKVHGFKGEIQIECRSLEKILQEMQQQHKMEEAEKFNQQQAEEEEPKHDHAEEKEKPLELEMLGAEMEEEMGKFEEARKEEEKPVELEKIEEEEEEKQTGDEEEKEETEHQMEAKEGEEKPAEREENEARKEAEKQPVEDGQKDGESEEKEDEGEKQTRNEEQKEEGKEETEHQMEAAAGNEEEKEEENEKMGREEEQKKAKNVEKRGEGKRVKRRKLIEEEQPELAENVEQKQKEGEKQAINVEEQQKQADGKRVKRRKLVKSSKTRGKKRPAESSPENEPNPKKPKMTKQKAGPTTSINQIQAATPLVQCCMCELIVNRARFEGRDSVYCSTKCITKKVELARKCFKKSERVTVADGKGKIRNNLTLASLEQFLLEYPTFQPVINAEIEAANMEKDPTEQEKIEKIRADARKAMENALVKRTTKSNMNFGGAKCQRTSVAIEAALFSFHTNQISERYMKWCKAFLDVLDDESNGYFCSVVREKVSAKLLVTLDPAHMKAPPPPPKPALVQPLVAAADSTTRVNMNGTQFATTSQHVPADMPPNNAQAKVRTVVDEILDMQNCATTTTSEAVTRRHHEHDYVHPMCAICKRNLEKMHELYKKRGMDQHWEKHLAREQQRPNSTDHNDKNHFPNLGPTISSAGEMWQQIVQQREMKQRQFRLNLFLNDNTTPPPPMAALNHRPTPTLNPPLAAESSGLTPDVTQMEIADVAERQGREAEQQENAEIVENSSHADPDANPIDDAADEIQTLAGNDDQDEQQEEIDKTGEMWISPTLQWRLRMRSAASLLSHQKENSAHGNATANPNEDPAAQNQMDEIQTLADEDEGREEEIDKTGGLCVSPSLETKLMKMKYNTLAFPKGNLSRIHAAANPSVSSAQNQMDEIQTLADENEDQEERQEEEIDKNAELELWVSPLLKSRLMGPEFNIAQQLPPPQMPAAEPISHGHAPEEQQEDLESPQSPPEFSDLLQEVSDDDDDPPPGEHPPAPAAENDDDREEGELSDEKSDDDDPHLPAENGGREEGELSDSDHENAALGNENGELEKSENENTPASGNGTNTSGNVTTASSKKRVRFQIPDNDNTEDDAFQLSAEFRRRQQHFDQHLPHPQQQTPKRYQPYNRPPRSGGPAANRRQSSDGNAANSNQKWPGWENVRFFS